MLQTTLRKSDRSKALQLSEIVRISEAARALKEQGKPILSFGTGEPDFPTPAHVVEAAHSAALDGKTTYPPTQGVLGLRTAIADQAGFPCDPSNVIVSNGAKQVLSNALQALLNPGDEAIVCAPYFTSYADMIRFCQAKMVTIPCTAGTGFLLTPEKLAAAITNKTRILMLNTPGNPSGAMYSKQELAALAEVLRAHPNVWMISDEIYKHIAYAPFHSFLEVAPDLADRTLVVDGVSKAHAMTGWRTGWGIGPVDLIQTMVAIQGQSTSGVSSISQAAAIAAINGPQGHLAERNAEFQTRRDFVVDELNKMDVLDCQVPQGAFYAFPSCSNAFGMTCPDGNVIEDDAAFCAYLLSAANVALVPGRAFGLPGHFRLSYAYALTELTEGLQRIASAVSALK